MLEKLLIFFGDPTKNGRPSRELDKLLGLEVPLPTFIPSPELLATGFAKYAAEFSGASKIVIVVNETNLPHGPIDSAITNVRRTLSDSVPKNHITVIQALDHAEELTQANVLIPTLRGREAIRQLADLVTTYLQ